MQHMTIGDVAHHIGILFYITVPHSLHTPPASSNPTIGYITTPGSTTDTEHRATGTNGVE